MADRILRDELLTSERYWSVSIEAQRLFVHLLLVVDDTARFSGKNFTIRSACFPGQAIDSLKLEKLIEELHGVDLVRIYEHASERFLFIPRFKQRLRYRHSKFPTPPKEINDLSEEKSDLSQSQDGPKPDSGQTQVGLKSANALLCSAPASPPLPPRSGGAPVETEKPKSQTVSRGWKWWESDWGIVTKGKSIGMEARVGEGMPEFKARVWAAVNAQKESKKA
jgi:hypothetical protein